MFHLTRIFTRMLLYVLNNQICPTIPQIQIYQILPLDSDFINENAVDDHLVHHSHFFSQTSTQVHQILTGTHNHEVTP